MSIDVLYQRPKHGPGTTLRDLDDVCLLAEVVTDDGERIAAGTEGTVVGVWNDGAAYEVEFAEPAGALATVEAAHLKYVGRFAP